jgi:hypothetical protein
MTCYGVLGRSGGSGGMIVVCGGSTLGGGGATLGIGGATLGGGGATRGSVAWPWAPSVGGTLGSGGVLGCGGGIVAGPSCDMMLLLFGGDGVD